MCEGIDHLRFDLLSTLNRLLLLTLKDISIKNLKFEQDISPLYLAYILKSHSIIQVSMFTSSDETEAEHDSLSLFCY